MIKNKTILVLGAGASNAYGFPLGSNLIDDIYKMVSGEHGIKNLEALLSHTEACDNPQKCIADLARAITKGRPGSIDDLLNARKDLSALGKICIALAISRYESEDTLYFEGFRLLRKWYDTIWRVLYRGANDIKQFAQNQLGIITFNYDRSFEHYMLNAALEFYKDKSTPDDIVAVIKNIPVCHVYGSVGYLEWQHSPNPMLTNGYEPLIKKIEDPGVKLSRNAADIFSKVNVLASQSIRTYEEGIEEGVRTNIENTLIDAKHVYFLGYGFHDQNNRLFDLKFAADNVDVKGTSFKMGAINKARALEALTRMAPNHTVIKNPTVEKLFDLDVDHFLAEKAVF